jgi:hypothetical protein
VRLIGEAFENVPYPGDSRLVEGYSSEAVEVADFLRGRRWQELRLDELVHNYASIFFMTAEAIRFYLPAYLIVSVLHYEAVDQIPGSVMFLLKPPVPADSVERSRFETRFGQLSKEQRRAVSAFLRYLRDEESQDFFQAEEASELLQWWDKD